MTGGVSNILNFIIKENQKLYVILFNMGTI